VKVLADADDPEFVQALAAKGFPRDEALDPESQPAPAGAGNEDPWPVRLHGSADPARTVRLQVREMDGPAWCAALLLRGWLRSEAGESHAYGALKRKLVESAITRTEYAAAKGAWLEMASARAEAWARHTGWSGT
jgi:dephospho-CoA kinase